MVVAEAIRATAPSLRLTVEAGGEAPGLANTFLLLLPPLPPGAACVIFEVMDSVMIQACVFCTNSFSNF